MLKIGCTYKVKSWEELEKVANCEFLGYLDFRPIVFLPEMESLCGEKIRITEKDNWYERVDNVYKGISLKTGEQYLFTEDMFFIPCLKHLIEVRDESKNRAKV